MVCSLGEPEVRGARNLVAEMLLGNKLGRFPKIRPAHPNGFASRWESFVRAWR